MTKKLSNLDLSLNPYGHFSTLKVAPTPEHKLQFAHLHKAEAAQLRSHQFSEITLGQAGNSKIDEERNCLVSLVQAIYRFIRRIFCCDNAREEAKKEPKPESEGKQDELQPPNEVNRRPDMSQEQKQEPAEGSPNIDLHAVAYLQRFEAVRNTPQVSPILFQALGYESLDQCHFSQIGQSLTQREIADYVGTDKDYFHLSSSWKTITPFGYDPLFGLITLDVDKLETFVRTALQRADMDVYLFVRLVNLVEKWNQPRLLSHLIQFMFGPNEPHDYLMDLFPSSLGFAYAYLAHAMQTLDSNFFLDRFYVKNRYLFEAACSRFDGLEKAKAWLDNQHRDELIPLSRRDENNAITAEEAVRQFKECRDQGEQEWWSLLHDDASFHYPVIGVKEVVKEMTNKEITFFSGKEYNCFRVTNTTDAGQFRVIHHLFNTQDQFKAFITGIMGRRDLVKGRAEFALLNYIVSLQSPEREDLLGIFISGATLRNKWKQILIVADSTPAFIFKGLLWQACATQGCKFRAERETKFMAFMDNAIPPEYIAEAIASIQMQIGLGESEKNLVITYLNSKNK